MMIFCKGRSAILSAALAVTGKRVASTQREIATLIHPSLFLYLVPSVGVNINPRKLVALKLACVRSEDWASSPISHRDSIFNSCLQIVGAHFTRHIGRLADRLNNPSREKNSEDDDAEKHDGDQCDNGTKGAADLCFNALSPCTDVHRSRLPLKDRCAGFVHCLATQSQYSPVDLASLIPSQSFSKFWWKGPQAMGNNLSPT